MANVRHGHFVTVSGKNVTTGIRFTYTWSKVYNNRSWNPSKLFDGKLVRNTEILTLIFLETAEESDQKLWNHLKKTNQAVSCDGDMQMSDDSYVSDRKYYPFRVTFENGKYELLLAEGIFSDGVCPVNYDPTKNSSTDGEHYQF